VGPAFPLTATLAVADRPFAGTVHNLSAEGLGFLTDFGPELATAGGVAHVGLDLGGFQFALRAELKHGRPLAGRFLCGLALHFDEFDVQKSYLQLMLPVVIGASLQKLEGGLVRQDEPLLHKLAFAGDALSKLTVWTKRADPRDFDSFELRMEECYVKGRAAPRRLQTFSLAAVNRAPDGEKILPVAFAGSQLDEEIVRLFRWSVLNMQANVPAEIRQFLGTLVA
jgi:hypothetical protein